MDVNLTNKYENVNDCVKSYNVIHITASSLQEGQLYVGKN